MNTNYILTSAAEVNAEVSTEVSTEDDFAVKLTTEKVISLLEYCSLPRSRKEMQDYCSIKSDEYFRKNIIVPMLAKGMIKMTIPDKPKSQNQKYVSIK